ncbi:MAG: hypothetical protein ACKO7D_01990 [Bacteroidota bacterium]|jgi:hypothetical protein
MRLLAVSFFLVVNSFLFSQSVYFESDVDVITYMDNKVFHDSSSGLNVEYGYISAYNTYGIKVTNKNDAVFYFINVSIDTYGSSADLYGMSPTTGDNFGFRLFKGKLIVGYGEDEPINFYLVE